MNVRKSRKEGRSTSEIRGGLTERVQVSNYSNKNRQTISQEVKKEKLIKTPAIPHFTKQSDERIVSPKQASQKLSNTREKLDRVIASKYKNAELKDFCILRTLLYSEDSQESLASLKEVSQYNLHLQNKKPLEITQKKPNIANTSAQNRKTTISQKSKSRVSKTSQDMKSTRKSKGFSTKIKLPVKVAKNKDSKTAFMRLLDIQLKKKMGQGFFSSRTTHRVPSTVRDRYDRVIKIAEAKSNPRQAGLGLGNLLQSKEPIILKE